MDLLSDVQDIVDAAAVRVPSVIEALRERIPTGQQAALTNQLSAGNVPTWLQQTRDEGAIMLAARCKRELAEHPAYGYAWIQTTRRFRSVLDWYEGRPLAPWLWVEVLAAVPTHKRSAAETIVAYGASFRHRGHAAMRWAIRGKVPTRALLFEQLLREGALTSDEALDGLADPPLRKVAERALADRVADIEDELRARLDGATPGARETIVRLLRTVDARVDSSGEVSESSLAELESRLRTDPTDAITAQVWADLLLDQGDPRGQLLALDLAIAGAEDPERALVLSGELATLTAQHRKAMFGRPGGFPFRDKNLGRAYIDFRSTWRAIIRGKPPTVLGKVMAFLAEATTATRPDTDVPLDLPGDADDATFRDRCLAEAKVVSATFRLVWPGTKIALPYQELGHYPDHALDSALRVSLTSGKLELWLWFPFETLDDPLFVRVYQQVADTLGKIVLTPTGFSLASPTVDGKKMKLKRQRYAGPARP